MTYTIPSRRQARRGRPRAMAPLTPRLKPVATPPLRALHLANQIPFILYEAGVHYMRLRTKALRLLESPRVRTTQMGEKVSSARTLYDPMQSARNTALMEKWLAVERYLRAKWERPRIQLLQRLMEEEALPRHILLQVGKAVYPLLEDLANLFQRLGIEN